MSDFNPQVFDDVRTGSAALSLREVSSDINNLDIFGDESSHLFHLHGFKSPVRRQQTSINDIDNFPSTNSSTLPIELSTELPQFDGSWLNDFDFSTLANDFTAIASIPEIDSQYPKVFTADVSPYPKDVPLYDQPIPGQSIFNDGLIYDDIDFWTSSSNQFNNFNNSWLPIEDIIPRTETPSKAFKEPEIRETGLSYEKPRDLFNLQISWTEQHKASNVNILGSNTSPSHCIFQAELKTLPQRVPGKRWIKTNKLTRGDNMRSTNASNIPQYTPLSQTPASWGTKQSDDLPLFRYTANGELYPSVKFSAEHIYEYIFSHPLNITPLGYYDPHNSPLVIWIGIAPADSARRYATAQSDKCRFKNCPVTHHSITKGTFRVTFDEQYFTDAELDPYNNAGYAHLYCFEKNLDFSVICNKANVQADTREFLKEKNKAAITHNNPEFVEFVRKFKELAQPWSESNPYSYKKTLCYKLTKGHLASESAARKKTRLARDAKMAAQGRFSNSLEKHMGNLDVFAANEREKRGQMEQKQIKQKEKRKSKKRKLTYTSVEGEDNQEPDASLEATLKTNLEKVIQEVLEVPESPNSLFDEPSSVRSTKRIKRG